MGVRRYLSKMRIWFRTRQAKWLNFWYGLEQVVLLIRHIEKESIPGVLRCFGAKIGENCDIESGLVLHKAKGGFNNLVIGNNCHIGKDVFIDLAAPVIIHEFSTISMRSTIITHFDSGNARLGNPYKKPNSNRVEIGPNVYLGAGVMVLAGVKIGEGSVIGAASLVNREILPNSLAVGVPTKVVSRYDLESLAWVKVE